MEAAFDGSWESGLLIQAFSFVLMYLATNIASATMEMFGIAICKDSAVVNCVTVFNRKLFIPVKFDGPYCTSTYNNCSFCFVWM